MKKYILAFATVAAMLASCSQDDSLEAVGNGTENNTPQPITTIYASSENGTRAVVNGDGSGILWQEGDKIGVYNIGMATSFTLSSGAGSTSGEFSNAESGITSISAVMHPYQEDATFANNKLSFEIPTVQEGVKGSFDKNAAIMYAFGSSANQQLSLAVNFLKLTIPVGVRSVVISSPSTSLTGKMELQDGNVSAVTDEGCNYVRLVPANGQTRFIAGDYYIAVKPGEIVTPTIRFVQDVSPFGGIILQENSKTSNNNIQFSGANNVVPLTVDFNTGDVTSRFAFQMWEGGPYFAQYNVGADGLSDDRKGGLYYWGGSQDDADNSDAWNGSGVLSGNHDTATKLWGVHWRMPTVDELRTLIANCDFELDGDKLSLDAQMELTSKWNNCKLTFDVIGKFGYGKFWSSTPVDDSSNSDAYNMYIYSTGAPVIRSSGRGNRCHIRAVLTVK